MSQDISQEQRDHYKRAVARAKAVLKRGDRVRVSTCGGAATYTFWEWDEFHPDFFLSKSGIDELHPYNITRLGGRPFTFRDR